MKAAVAAALTLILTAPCATVAAQDLRPAADQHATDPAVEAEEALVGAVERSENGDPALLATNLRNLASFYQTRMRYAEARALHERALDVRERAFGANHPDVVQSLDDLASLDLTEGRLADAQQRFERTLRIQRKLYGKDDLRTAINVNNLARLNSTRGQHRQAAALYRTELGMLERAYGADSVRLLSALENLAREETKAGKPGAAEAYYRRAITIADASDVPASSRRLFELLEGYAALLRGVDGRTAEAAALDRRAAEVRASNPGADRRVDNE